MLALSVLGLGGCSADGGSNGATSASAVPTLKLTATAETVPVGTVARDAADDPAIWRNPDNPGKSLVIGTDKRAGLYVFGMDGSQKSFLPEGELNNVDVREVMIDGRKTVLVGASIRNDRNHAHIGLYRLDTASAKLQPLGKFAAGAGEAYGFCLGQDKGGVPNAEVTREHKLATQPEGCVVDDRTGRLYVGEENVAIWIYDLNADAFVPQRFADVNGRELVADVEGLALAPKGKNGGYLVASSQGDNAYVLYDLSTGKYVNRFRLVDGVVDGTSETDGIEVILGDFGPDYPDGLMVAQDGDNGNQTQNFKYVSWRRVMEVLEGSK